MAMDNSVFNDFCYTFIGSIECLIAAYPVLRRHLANCVPIIRLQLDISNESDDSSLICPEPQVDAVCCHPDWGIQLGNNFSSSLCYTIDLR